MKNLSVLLLALALALALAACNLGASSPSAQPLPSIGTESSMAADHSMEASADASADATSVTGMTCADAVAAIDVTAITTLDEASDALDDTIASCEDVADWQAEMSAAVPLLDLTEAEAFLAARCAENATLADTPICQEVAM